MTTRARPHCIEEKKRQWAPGAARNRHPHNSVTRPIKELKAFQKIKLVPGEKKTVTLEVMPMSLAF